MTNNCVLGLPDCVNKLAKLLPIAFCFSLYLTFFLLFFSAALMWFGLIIQEY